MAKLTYDRVFKGACGTGSQDFAKAFPRGASSESAIIKQMAARTPGYFHDAVYYMTPVARRTWRSVLQDYTNAKTTDFEALNTMTQKNVLTAFLARMAQGMEWNRTRNEYDVHDGTIFKGTRKAA